MFSRIVPWNGARIIFAVSNLVLETKQLEAVTFLYHTWAPRRCNYGASWVYCFFGVNAQAGTLLRQADGSIEGLLINGMRLGVAVNTLAIALCTENTPNGFAVFPRSPAEVVLALHTGSHA